MDDKSTAASSSNDARTKKKRKPEMVRYQPPSSRNTSNVKPSEEPQLTTPKTTKSYRSQRKPDPTPPVVESKPDKETIPPVVKPVHGGLLKLNTEMTSQIKASKEAAAATAGVDDSDRQAKEYCKNFRSLKYDRGQQSSGNAEDSVKMLFNPNNPDKPIYKKIQNSKQREIRFECNFFFCLSYALNLICFHLYSSHVKMSSRNEAEQIDVHTSGHSRNPNKQQRQTSQPSNADREEVLQLAKQMAQLEQSLNGLYDAYENDGRRFEQGKLKIAAIKYATLLYNLSEN